MRTPLPAPRHPVVRRPLGHGMIEIRRLENVPVVERIEAFLPQPVAQHLDDTPAQRLGLHHAAVEEHVRRTGEAARAPSWIAGAVVPPLL